jgi:predicted nuclease of predicted toxin-antitoxin system
VTLRVLIDMNLSPRWVDEFARHGIESVHWSSQGTGSESDAEIMAWARDRGFIVFTHDLDFGGILASTGATGPSVVQVRAKDILPEAEGRLMSSLLRTHEESLMAGAILVVDRKRGRVRLLPL